MLWTNPNYETQQWTTQVVPLDLSTYKKFLLVLIADSKEFYVNTIDVFPNDNRASHMTINSNFSKNGIEISTEISNGYRPVYIYGLK